MLKYNMVSILEKTNPCTGWNAEPCNGPLRNYDFFFGDVTQKERADNYMRGRDRLVDCYWLYPWRRDIVATSSFPTSAKDICSSPKGVPVPGITKLGVGLYKAPINGLPPYNNNKCYDCNIEGINCRNCEGTYKGYPSPCYCRSDFFGYRTPCFAKRTSDVVEAEAGSPE